MAWTTEVKLDGKLHKLPTGHISCGTLEPASAGYIAAYATKSMDVGDHDKSTPDGCIPEFSRQSLRPGIGAGVADDIASALLQNNTYDIRDLPTYLSHGRNQRPLGRYLRRRISERLGHSREEFTKHGLTRLENKLLPLRQIALAAKKGSRHWQFREEIVNLSNNRRLQQDKRYSIYKAKRKIV